MKQSFCERNLTIWFRPKRDGTCQAVIVARGGRDKTNVSERQIEAAHCRLDNVAPHDRLTDRQRFRIFLPRLNDHAEMDALGLKRRPVFKFLPCDRVNALACANRNFEGATKERGRRQNNPDYSIRSLQADPEKMSGRAQVPNNPTRQWSHCAPRVRLLKPLRHEHRPSRRRDGSPAPRCRGARRRGTPARGRGVPSATSLQNPATPRAPAPKATWRTNQRTVCQVTRSSVRPNAISVPDCDAENDVRPNELH